MDIEFFFAAMSVTDIAAATAFYAKVLGREPDDRSMDTLVQWRYDRAGIQLFADADKAGHATMTLVVPDMDAAGELLAAQDIDIASIQRGDYGGIARFRDPHGIEIVLAELPSRPFSG